MELPHEDQIRRTLAQVRPYIQADGGDLEFVALEPGGTVAVRLTGNCVGCGSAGTTLHSVILACLQSEYPWVRTVRDAGEGETASGATQVGATRGLEHEHERARGLMSALEQDLMSLKPPFAMPPSVADWISFSRGTLRPHFELEEACVYPAMDAVFGPADGGPAPSATLVAEHRQYFRLLAAFESAVTAYAAAPSVAAYGAVLSEGHTMLGLLARHFLREEGGLFAMLEDGLPAELQRELAGDIAMYRRRTIPAFAA